MLWWFLYSAVTGLQVYTYISSVVSDSATQWTRARQASLPITSSRSSLKLMSIESVMPSNHLILCHPLLPPSIFPSLWVFSSESALHIRWPKYWSFSFNISPSNEYSGLISFRMDWLDLLGVQGTLKSLPQHHSSKASILQLSAFFTVQLSNPNTTTGKTIALIRPTFVGKRLIVHKKTLLRTSCKEVVWISEKSFQSEDSNIRCSVFPSSNLELQAKQYKRLF